MNPEEVAKEIEALGERPFDDAAAAVLVVYRDEIMHALRSVAAERRRCAKIARNLISKDKDWDNGLWNQACERIALTIETNS